MEPPVPSRPILLAFASVLFSTPVWAAPQVVASIQPIQSLVAGVMETVGEPGLLIPAGRSPHGFQLRPSEAAALQRADLVVWVGEDLETFLVKPLQSLDEGRALELMSAPGVELLENRAGGVWEEHQDEHAHGHDDDDGHDHGEHDPHIWLSPANAKAIVAAVAGELSRIDPAHAAVYAGNAASLAARIGTMETELQDMLGPVRAKPFVVFHDAFQYFEQAFGLNGVGSISLTPDQPPSARRLAELRRTIAARGAVCAFGEPQSRTGLLDTVVEGTGVATGLLDPEGSAGLPTGAEGYLALMRGNAQSLVACLSRGS